MYCHSLGPKLGCNNKAWYKKVNQNIAGPLISQTPRGGDELATAHQLDLSAREGRTGEGWEQVLVGGDQWSGGYCTDLGYVVRLPNLGRDIPRLSAQLEAMDCLHIHPGGRAGGACWVFDPATRLLRLDPEITDKVGIERNSNARTVR